MVETYAFLLRPLPLRATSSELQQALFAEFQFLRVPCPDQPSAARYPVEAGAFLKADLPSTLTEPFSLFGIVSDI